MIWIKRNKIHILIWALFIFWEAIVVGIMFNNFGSPYLYIAHYLVIILLFYFQSDWLLPIATRNNRSDFIRVPLILAFQLTLYITSHYLADVILMLLKFIPYRLNYGFDYQFILRNLYRGIFFMGFSTGYYFLKTYLKERKRAADLEKEHLNAIITQKNTEKELFKAQNAFLKAQINPHFLFNTLNFIHNKVSTSSPEAAEAVISLAEMMRYAISSDEQGGVIRLGDEMEQVSNLVNLFRLRKSQELFVNVVFEEKTKQLMFIPLVLLTLTENMFKHGQLHDPNHPASIYVYIEEDSLCLETSNLSQPQKSNRSHTGLANIKERLNYAYGEQISFYYATDAEDYFTLKIGVTLVLINGPVL